MKRRVVITGIGIRSCIGNSISKVRDSLYNGISGLGLDESRKSYGLSSGYTGILDLSELDKLNLPNRLVKSMSDHAKLAYLASLDAYNESNLLIGKDIVGLIYGNDSSSDSVSNCVDKLRDKKSTKFIGTGYPVQVLTSSVGIILSSIFKISGFNFCISNACTSGLMSIGMSYILISNGYSDIILSGGCQEVNYLSALSFDSLGLISPESSSGSKYSSRPFNSNRLGLVPSGGAASLIIESLDSALSRNANIIAEIKGFGMSSNGDGNLLSSNRDGLFRAMGNALYSSYMSINDIDYINAHATSTIQGDLEEGSAYISIGAKDIPISSTKCLTGHEMWMSGASSTIYSIIMMNNDFISPNFNLDDVDDNFKLLNLPNKVINTKLNNVMINSSGFGGSNSSLIIGKYEE